MLSFNSPRLSSLAPFAAPAHVSIEIASEGGNHDTVQVDDVLLVESESVEALLHR